MENYVCNACNWVYEPEKGDSDGAIPKGTPFSELPADWICPMCGVGKDMFSPEN